MTQKEFEDRTKMVVSADEFEVIHDMYMACGDGCDKDEFCELYTTKVGREDLMRMMASEHKITEDALRMATDDKSLQILTRVARIGKNWNNMKIIKQGKKRVTARRLTCYKCDCDQEDKEGTHGGSDPHSGVADGAGREVECLRPEGQGH